MLNFLIDNVFVQFGGRLFQQTVGIPMGTNCAPLLADLFLYSYESEFLDGLKKRHWIELHRMCNNNEKLLLHNIWARLVLKRMPGAEPQISGYAVCINNFEIIVTHYCYIEKISIEHRAS